MEKYAVTITLTGLITATGLITVGPSYQPFSVNSTIWNANDKSTIIALTNGDLTAEITSEPSPNTRKGVRSIYSASSGKYYWEITTLADYSAPGLALSTWGLDSGTQVEVNSGFVGITQAGNPLNTMAGATTVGTNAGDTTGATVSIALDIDNGKMWISSTGTWPNSGDPAAGTNPFFTLPANTFYAAQILQALNPNKGKVTANFGQNTFTGIGVPTGFNMGFGLPN